MKIIYIFIAINAVISFPSKERFEQNKLSRKKRFVGWMLKALDTTNEYAQTGIMTADLANSVAQTGIMGADLDNSYAQTDIMEKDLANNIVQTGLMAAELAESKKGNGLAERANWISEKANVLAQESNKIAMKGNQHSEKANYISEEANEIARSANEIAMMDLDVANRANYLSKKIMEQDLNIAKMTMKQTKRLSDASTELDIMLNGELTNSITSGFKNVAFAIKDGLKSLGGIIKEATYREEITQTEMVAKTLYDMYTDYMLNNQEAHLTRAEAMKTIETIFELNLDNMERVINLESFSLDRFLHIAHLNTQEMDKADCDWSNVRSRGFAINTMFMVLNQTIKRRNIQPKFVPPIFEHQSIEFFESYLTFNVRSSYEFETRCFRNKVCFDSHFTKMPSDLHCYNDEEKVAAYCDFSVSCEKEQADLKREKLSQAKRLTSICMQTFMSRDCGVFERKASDFIDNLPTCALKLQPGLCNRIFIQTKKKKRGMKIIIS